MDHYFNAVCTVCGKKYHVCQSCRKIGSFVPWRTVADSPACYQIFQILSSHTNNRISDQEAKKRLSECDLKELDTFLPDIQKSIRSLLQ